MDRVATTTYPDGEVATMSYNAQGLPETLSGSGAYTCVDGADYAAAGQLKLLTFGGAGLDLQIQYDYNDGANEDQRLHEIWIGRPGSGPDGPDKWGRLTYGYDGVGNVTQIEDRRWIAGQQKLQTQTFTYDPLDRLTGASASGAGEWVTYTHTYAYTTTGNLTNNNGVIYTYPAAGQPRPHAVTGTGSGGSFSYDYNGNMISRRLEATGVTYTQTWDTDNRLASVTADNQTTSFTYDGNGTLVKKVGPSGTTVYVGNQYELKPSTTALAGGNLHSLAITTDGTVAAWGYNQWGQLGDGTTTNRTTPVQVSGLSGVIAVGGGARHSLALKSDGTVWAWGDNTYGQLGDGTTTSHSTPAPVNGLTGVTAISVGNGHNLALKSDGTVWAWGLNDHGQLGDGATTNRSEPVPVYSLSGVSKVAAGWYHSLALKADLTLRAWGSNQKGQLGDGTTTEQHTPVVCILAGVTSVSVGGHHSLATRMDGSAWAWGDNTYGQLGDGTTTDSSTPVRIGGPGGVTALAAGRYHSLARKSDGTVWAWGRNDHGQLGDGTTTNRSSPVQASDLSGITAVAGGGSHSLARKNDQVAWAVGYNACGQLGDGTTTERSIAAPVTGLISTKYYYFNGQRVAMKKGGVVYYIAGDHLGTTSVVLTVQNDQVMTVSESRHYPYGGVRWENGTLQTDYRFAGQRLDSYIKLYAMGARMYDPYIDRFVSPDTIIPDPANAQSLNRYSYCLGNPLKFVDPSGHDPLDAAWQAEFRKIHGRDPTPEDMLIRLFSIAFPGEWNSDIWNALYTADGQLRTEALNDLFDNIPGGRDWSAMPGAIGSMASWYKKGETEAFIRDIGSLFGGLRSRFESGWVGAVTGGVVRHFVSIGRNGLPAELTGTDEGGNVHHWAWTVNLGYFMGGFLGRRVNAVRERVDTIRDFLQCDANCHADLGLGAIGANMGKYMSHGLLPPRSPSMLQKAWQLMPLQVSQ